LFLTDDGVLEDLAAPPLIVQYDVPTAAASGVILDIDYDEMFMVQARDARGVVIATVTIHAGNPQTGDGIATPWSIERDRADIYSIRFVGHRTVDGAFGLGFDNFCTRSTRGLGDILVDFGAGSGLWMNANYAGPAPRWAQLNGQSPTHMARGDIDGDGTMDLIASDY
jgi:hypothetical protein